MRLKIVKRCSIRTTYNRVKIIHAIFYAGLARINKWSYRKGMDKDKVWRRWCSDGDVLRNQLHSRVKRAMAKLGDLPNFKYGMFTWDAYGISRGGVCPNLLKKKEFREYILRGWKAKRKPLRLRIVKRGHL